MGDILLLTFGRW